MVKKKIVKKKQTKKEIKEIMKAPTVPKKAIYEKEMDWTCKKCKKTYKIYKVFTVGEMTTLICGCGNKEFIRG